MLTGFHDFLGIFPVWSCKNTIAGSGKFCALPKKDFFFIKPGKVFRALQGYFLTMLGKGVSSQRRGPENLSEDSGLGNSNRPASSNPPARSKRKHQSPFYAGVAEKAVHRMKWFAWCQNLPTMFWMWLWTSSVLKWHLYGGFRNSLYFPSAECDKIEWEWDHHKFSEERSSGKRGSLAPI